MCNLNKTLLLSVALTAALFLGTSEAAKTHSRLQHNRLAVEKNERRLRGKKGSNPPPPPPPPPQTIPEEETAPPGGAGNPNGPPPATECGVSLMFGTEFIPALAPNQVIMISEQCMPEFSMETATGQCVHANASGHAIGRANGRVYVNVVIGTDHGGVGTFVMEGEVIPGVTTPQLLNSYGFGDLPTQSGGATIQCGNGCTTLHCEFVV
jgi:hypothetical protein